MENLLVLLPVLLIIVTGCQLFYYLFIFTRLGWYKERIKTNTQEYPVSVIICARNEAERLAENLPGALCQQYRTTHEVIVVNDNSQDETKYLLEEFQKQFKQLNVIPLLQEAVHIPGKKFPLSMGIKAARHEMLLLTDADCVPASEHWIASMQGAFKEGIEIVLGYGAIKKEKGLLNKLVRFETFHTALQYLSYALWGYPYMGVGRNLSYLKDVFNRNKGFSAINHIPGGDDDLFINKVANKRNTAIMIHADSFTMTAAPSNWLSWFQQKRRHYTTARYYRPIHKFLLAVYALLHTIFYPLLVATAFLYDWQIAAVVFSLRIICLYIVWSKALQKLGEKDLIPWLLFFDVWLVVYNILFTTSIWRKPAKQWR
jgi:glycosyltransferase involved in cell wall biosynthesis